MSDEDLHCWKVEGPISGISGQYPTEAEYDPNQEVTILFW